MTKICKDCKHFVKGKFILPNMCSHPALITVHRITGKIKMVSCKSERYPKIYHYTICRPTGDLFEQK